MYVITSLVDWIRLSTTHDAIIINKPAQNRKQHCVYLVCIQYPSDSGLPVGNGLLDRISNVIEHTVATLRVGQNALAGDIFGMRTPELQIIDQKYRGEETWNSTETIADDMSLTTDNGQDCQLIKFRRSRARMPTAEYSANTDMRFPRGTVRWR